MAKLDITRTNDAVTRLLEVTENPRHRFMLLTYYRHRFLEIAGRYEEIFAPDMMADNPVYHFNALGINARLEGQDQVKALYAQWAKTGECVFHTDDEELSIGDGMICSIATGYSPSPARCSARAGSTSTTKTPCTSTKRSRKWSGPLTTAAALPVRTCGSPIPTGQRSASWIQPM
jgi:hypothetical protein